MKRKGEGLWWFQGCKNERPPRIIRLAQPSSGRQHHREVDDISQISIETVRSRSGCAEVVYHRKQSLIWLSLLVMALILLQQQSANIYSVKKSDSGTPSTANLSLYTHRQTREAADSTGSLLGDVNDMSSLVMSLLRVANDEETPIPPPLLRGAAFDTTLHNEESEQQALLESMTTTHSSSQDQEDRAIERYSTEGEASSASVIEPIAFTTNSTL